MTWYVLVLADGTAAVEGEEQHRGLIMRPGQQRVSVREREHSSRFRYRVFPLDTAIHFVRARARARESSAKVSRGNGDK